MPRPDALTCSWLLRVVSFALGMLRPKNLAMRLVQSTSTRVDDLPARWTSHYSPYLPFSPAFLLPCPLGPQRELSDMPLGPERKAVTIKALFNQVVEGLDAMHGMGIVHRDVKGENLVLTDDGRPGGARLKFVDFGGAADLRIGLNYAPKEYLMDPRFAAPEQYIMTTQTPNPPPVPVALLLSPILWQLNLPDRFDMFSAGLILLQMCLPSLRFAWLALYRA